MGKLNPNLQKIIDFYYAIDNEIRKVFSKEEDLLNLIDQYDRIEIDNAIIEFKLDVKKVIQYLEKKGLEINNIRITNTELCKGVSFCEIEIPGNLYFWENICGDSDFSRCKINGYSYFSNTVFKDTACFNQTIFGKDTFFWGVTFSYESYFRECEFCNRIDFWCAEFKNRADFNYALFRKDVDFSNCFFYYTALFQNTIWGDNKSEASNAIFDNASCQKLISFNGSNFKSEISISYVLFNFKAEFEKCSFWCPIVSNKSFFSAISFAYSHFYSPVYLNGMQGKNIRFLFNNIWSDSLISINCYNTKNELTSISYFSFDSCIISRYSIVIVEGFSLSNDAFRCNYCSILGTLTVYNSVVKQFEMKCTSIIGSVILKNADIKEIDLSDSTSSGRIITNSNSYFTPLNRESARILRHEKEKDSDIIMALNYRTIEMKKYNEMLNNMSFFKKMQNLEEMLIIKLNYWSNDYGQSWAKGIAFTCTISFITTFILMTLSKNIIFDGSYLNFFLFTSKFWIGVIDFLWIPSTSLEKCYPQGVLYTILYLVGKVLVAYGMFQTAASFRKYSKG